jgi:putative serine protease PepD
VTDTDGWCLDASTSPPPPSPPPPTAPPSARRVLGVVALVAALAGGAAGGAAGALLARPGAGGTAPSAGAGPAGTRQVATPGFPLAAIAARVLPSVVTIDVVSGGEGGTGSGLVVRSDGYILTNSHVVTVAGMAGPATGISVVLDKGVRVLPARVVGRDLRTDLAVLKVDTPVPLPVAPADGSGSLAVGAPVAALGAPLGLAGSVTVGVVSALDRGPTVPLGRSAVVLTGAIQTDAAINPGNSGGPLVDAAGRVIGIDSALAAVPGDAATETGSIGVGFAIPIAYARSIAEEIIRTGRATHPDLGVQVTTVPAAEAHALAAPAGALVAGVTDGGPADRAGLRAGDTIISVGGRPVGGTIDLISATRLHRPGDVVTVTYIRGGMTRTTPVRIWDAPN